MLAKESIFSAVCQFLKFCQSALIDPSSHISVTLLFCDLSLFHVLGEHRAKLCSAKLSADFHGRNARIFRVRFVHFF